MEFDYLKEYLPVGSVVSVRFNYDLKIMITGYAPHSLKDNKVHDYIGVVYPYGFDDYEKTLIFDKEIIKKVHHIGYQNEVYDEFKNIVRQAIDKYKSDKTN